MCAVIKQGILGGLSGSVGSVTGSSWKGIAVLKAKPLSVANPKTAKQLAQRSKMSQLVELFKLILSTIIKPLNDRFASKMSGFNLVIQQSMGAFDISGVLTDYSKIFITPSSKGEQVVVMAAPSAAAEEIDISWVSSAGVGTQLASDLLYVAFVNEDNGKVISVGGSEDRSNQAATIAADNDFMAQGDTIHMYAAFLKSDGTIVYKQHYTTKVVLL